MNHERFIEMLNLYTDRELVGAEIQEIEEAIASSPERQRIYAQYCKMERATQKLLAETDAPQPRVADLVAAAQSDAAGIVDFEPAPQTVRPIWQTWGGAVAGLAAACFAFVAYFGTPSDVVEESGIAQSIPHPTPVRTLNHVDEDPYQTVFVLNERDSAGRVPGMKAVDDSFAWMAQLQFAPIERTEIDAWEMAPATPLEVRSLNTRWVSPEDVPQAMTAFQFQR
ncbi:hypothetical protein N9K67_07660 [Opitutaceae bacterium]|nr:hypothetical protein [Opitutaceae bacterium]